MTQKQMIRALADERGMTKQEVEDFFDDLVTLIGKEVKKGEPAILPGLGRVRLVSRKARTGRNPRTGEPMKIKASKKLKFTFAKPLREKLGSK